MSFTRIKTITKNGRTYRYTYRQTSVRVGTKVRSKMEYLGPVGGSARHTPEARQDRVLATAERVAKEMDAYQVATFGETGEERAAREKQEGRFDQGKFLESTRSAGEAVDDEKGPDEGPTHA